jgi:hypothetical protein
MFKVKNVPVKNFEFLEFLEYTLQRRSGYKSNDHQSKTHWKIISFTSMEVDFWGVKRSDNSHATEVKCSNIPQNKFHTEKEAK